MAEDPRSRYLYNDVRRSVLLVNYKCGFTSVTDALGDDPAWKMDIKNPEPAAAAFESGRFDGYDVHMVARDPETRILSYYWNWLVEKDETFEGPFAGTNRHFRILRDTATDSEYQTFVTAGQEGRKTPEMFDLWLRWLPTLWQRDAHLWPQYLIYDDLGLSVNDIHQWPLASLGRLLKHFGATEQDNDNQTGASRRTELYTDQFHKVVRHIYRRDFDELQPALDGLEPTIALSHEATTAESFEEEFASIARQDHMLPERIIESVYRLFLNPSDVAIDAGAHVGRHTIPLAEACPQGHVVSFEALPSYAEKLNAINFEHDNVTVRWCALQNNPNLTETSFQFVEDEPARSGIVSSSINIAEHLQFGATDITVPASTIDTEMAELDIDPRRVRFMKLDLEGGEFHALLGAASVIKAARPIIVFENNYFSPGVVGYTTEQMDDFFREHRYQRITIFGEPSGDDHAFWYMFAAPEETADLLASYLSATAPIALERAKARLQR